MKRGAFGRTSLQVSELGLGCARIGGVFQHDTKAFIDLLRGAFDAGINFFDTADMYSQGESERLIGSALGDRRDRIVIASKVGYQLPTRRRLLSRLKPLLRPAVQLLRLRRGRFSAAAGGTISQCFEPRYLRSAVEASLRRLRTDYLDLLQLHSPPLEIVEGREWEGALEELKRVGKIRYYGVAVDSVDAGRAALRCTGVSSLQFRLSLLEPAGATELFPLARAQGVAGIAREVLANGLLVKPSAEVDLQQYCSSPAEVTLRTAQLAELRDQQGSSLLKRALEFPRGVDGVNVTLLGARNIQQLNKLIADGA